MGYFLGIDGGATKTEGVIIDENEKIIAHTFGGPVNYHQDGEGETAKNLEETIGDALAQANLKIEDISFAVLGLAGLDTPDDKKILNRLAQDLLNGGLKERVKVVSDVETAFASCITKDYGIVLISGTGANCFGRGKKGKIAWAGNWGWLLGDQGSGFALGLAALQMVMRDFDGRGEKTVLTKLILDKLCLKQALEINNWIYQKEVPVAEIASLAPLVFEAYKKGDKIAQSLVNKLVVEMVISLKTVARKTDLVDEEFEIGLVGGIFKEEIAVELLKDRVKQSLPKGKIVLAEMEPAMAAAIMAKKSL